MKIKQETSPKSGRAQDIGGVSSKEDLKPNLEQRRIGEWIEKLRFRRQFFGGVSEEDVWKKIDELHAMYQAALNAERIRYDTMIENYKKKGEVEVAKGTP